MYMPYYNGTAYYSAELIPCACSYDGAIAHYGIAGMHWGVRRFQNEDGSVKPAGAKRYYDGIMTTTNKKGDKNVKPIKGSAADKKIQEQKETKKENLSDDEKAVKRKERLKKAAKIGAAAAGVAIAAYGAYSLKQYSDIRKKVIEDTKKELDAATRQHVETKMRDLVKYTKSGQSRYTTSQLKDKQFRDSFANKTRNDYLYNYGGRGKGAADAAKKQAKKTTRAAYKEFKTQKIKNLNPYNKAFSRQGEYSKYYEDVTKKKKASGALRNIAKKRYNIKNS